jgi:hypothetical protein
MKNDYMTNEIADTTIGPNRSISGIIFVAPLSSGQLFNVPLVNRETGERLVFQFQSNQQGAVNIQSSQGKKEKEKEKEKKEPKKNFGP